MENLKPGDFTGYILESPSGSRDKFELTNNNLSLLNKYSTMQYAIESQMESIIFNCRKNNSVIFNTFNTGYNILALTIPSTLPK